MKAQEPWKLNNESTETRDDFEWELKHYKVNQTLKNKDNEHVSVQSD